MAALSLQTLLLAAIGTALLAGVGDKPGAGPGPQANEVLFKQGYSEIIADPESIPLITLRTGYKTLLLLPGDEKIVRVEVGVRGSALELKYGQNWVAIRPNVERLMTNVHIATDRGSVYSFDLQENSAREPHKKVVVLRPDMDLDGDSGVSAPPAPRPAQQSGAVSTSSGRTVAVDDLGALSAPAIPPAVHAAAQSPAGQAQRPVSGDPTAPKQQGAATPLNAVVQNVPGVPGAELVRRLDKDYKISNGKAKLCNIESVFNDGQRTFVVFSSPVLEAPLFYRQTAGGKREILTYRIEPAKDHRDKDIFMIPMVVDSGIVKLGDAESTFSWRKIHG